MRLKLSALVALCSLTALPLLGQEGTTPYFPLKAGSKWVYRVGEDQVVVKVLKLEPLKLARKPGSEEGAQKVTGATLEMSSGGRAPLKEQIAVLKNGVYRFSAAGKDIIPPLCILKLPAQSGDAWSVDSTIGDVKVKGTFRTGEATVGKYKCITSVLQSDESGSDKITLEYFFASGVGIVKQRVRLRSIDSTMELEKYEP